MNFLMDYGLFLLKAITVVVAILVVVGGILSSGRKSSSKIELHDLNDLHRSMMKQVTKFLGIKLDKKKKSKQKPPTLYVVDFVGDIKASQVDALREEVTAILCAYRPMDEVLLRIESPGGAVNGYGLAAAEIARLKSRHIPLTVCIDKVAASGGYLMACLAEKIIAAPFAIIGSIGVVAQIPNFHRWLKEKNIDVEVLTAGEYKRTLTIFGENTEKGRQKFKEDLEKIHVAFRNYVLNYRQAINIDEVATGEHWLAVDAKELKLVDEIQTSDDYLLSKYDTFRCVQVRAHHRQTFFEKILQPASRLLHPFA